jgi:aerobic carbon-monoxide dehydrogenase large subunit
MNKQALPEGSLGWIGKSMPRVEDRRYLEGRGRYLDDISLPDMLHAVFLRSPVAHGKIRSIDVSAARDMAGVHFIFTYGDLRAVLMQDRIPQAMAAGAIKFDVDPYVLAKDEVCHAGEPIAIILADSRHEAEDALLAIDLDIDELPAVVDPFAGLEPGSPNARSDCPNNLVARHSIEYGDLDRAFSTAAHVFKQRYRLDKGGGHSIETRGIVARHDSSENLLTVWDSTQMPHRAKALLVASLGMSENQIRVITPDVGGGFGPKAVFYPEELAIPAASILSGRPVKWTEDRRENFVATYGERLQDWDMEVACDADGHLLGMRGRLCHDHGSATPYGVALPYNAGTNVVGPYDLPAFKLDICLCLTNMGPAVATRGAGRPQGTFVMERFLDRIAKELQLSRDEVRRRNLIPADKMPFPIPIKQRDGSMMEYDSGDYPACMAWALREAGWDNFETRRQAVKAQGRLLGIGLANYVEATGRGPFESASVKIGPSGNIMVATGATDQGQGTRSMMAQLVADALDVSSDDIHIVDGDTAATDHGLGAFASRQAVTAGNAIHLAARNVANKAREVASHMLEAAPVDLELKGGYVSLKGAPDVRKSLGEIANAISGAPGFAMPGNLPPGLSSAVDFSVTSTTYCNGTHLCEAEVDPETGMVKLTRYVVVHDCGRMINPRLVEGQVLGGVVHGIGQALFEHMRYSDDGQPLTMNYGDYLLPTAPEIPRIEIHHMESPTPLNPLGVKGAAESGTIAAPSAIISAIEDALQPLDITIAELPLTPERLLDLINRATSR